MALTRKKQTDRLSNQVITVLAQHFRDGKYDAGYSDRHIAVETGTSKLFVAEVRQFRLAPTMIRASGSPIGTAFATPPASEADATAE